MAGGLGVLVHLVHGASGTRVEGRASTRAAEGGLTNETETKILITVKEKKKVKSRSAGRKGDATIDCNSGTVVLVGAIG